MTSDMCLSKSYSHGAGLALSSFKDFISFFESVIVRNGLAPVGCLSHKNGIVFSVVSHFLDLASEFLDVRVDILVEMRLVARMFAERETEFSMGLRHRLLQSFLVWTPPRLFEYERLEHLSQCLADVCLQWRGRSIGPSLVADVDMSVGTLSDVDGKRGHGLSL